MELQKLLKRQLEKLDLNNDELPCKLEKWQKFLTHINKTYLEVDQERYLIERSMSISSREMLEINEQLEYAQHLADLCYWHYNSANRLMTWSKGIFDLLEIDPLNPELAHFDFFLELIHPADRVHIKKCIEKALAKKMDFDFEIQIRTKTNCYKWFRFIIKPTNTDNKLSGIIIDINTKKNSELKINELNSALVTAARLAGMSEVATNILHNIGNLLNSTNVSVAIIKQNVIHLKHKKLSTLVDMIKKNIHQINDFLINDHKGKLILPYLEKMSDVLEKEYKQNNEEVLHLEKKLDHIKEIVAMQKTLSGVVGFSEKISISKLLDDAVEISGLLHSGIMLTKKEAGKIKTIISDKSKLLQILTNLLRNAKDAVLSNVTIKKKEIGIFLFERDKNNISINVKDNGVGIPAENLDRIFSFGFTTKENGHGFGLHSSALSARELGGSLNVQSLGMNHGAEFILILPVTMPGANSGELL